MSQENEYQKYVTGVLENIKDDALEVRKELEGDPPDEPASWIDKKRLEAYREFFQFVRAEAETCGVSWEELKLKDFSPEKDLA